MIGAHVSIAGGVENGPQNGVRLGCEAIQIFTRSQRRWTSPPLSPQGVRDFRERFTSGGLRKAIAHASYLFNPCGEGRVLELTRQGLLDEWDRSEALGLLGLVLHPGAHCGAGEEAGLDRIVACLDAVAALRPRHVSLIIIENTAGQGSCLGWRFEHLSAILTGVRRRERFGVCLDTAHLFAAGHDIRTAEGLERALDEFGRVVGWSALKAFHLNDSKTPLGSRVDRHEHIGKGAIGLEPFRALVNDQRFEGIPKILETPEDGGGYPMDLRTLRRLRGTPAAKRASLPAAARTGGRRAARAPSRPPRARGKR